MWYLRPVQVLPARSSHGRVLIWFTVKGQGAISHLHHSIITFMEMTPVVWSLCTLCLISKGCICMKNSWWHLSNAPLWLCGEDYKPKVREHWKSFKKRKTTLTLRTVFLPFVDYCQFSHTVIYERQLARVMLEHVVLCLFCAPQRRSEKLCTCMDS